MHIQCARVAHVTRLPHLFHELFAAQDLIGVAHKFLQQPRQFGGEQMLPSAVHVDGTLAQIKRQRPKAHNLFLSRIGG